MHKTWGVVLLALSACGDPRAKFVGTYEGVETMTWADGKVYSYDVSFEATAPKNSDRVQFSGRCMFTGEAVDDDTIQMDPIACPTFRASTTNGGEADFTNTYMAGVATLTNKTLSITRNGTQTGTNYSNATGSAQFNFRSSMTATRK